LAGTPLLCEHDHGDRVGTVLASWKGPDGSLRIAANVENAEAIAQVRRGGMRGLSLGTAMTLGPDGSVAYRGQDELSICEEGKRPGTWIDTMNGVSCRAVECFSKSAADQNRDELVSRLKAELADKTEGEARANARMEIYEGKERARISAWQDDAKFFMSEFVNEEVDAHHPGLKDDVAPLGAWASTYTDKADIASQGALAAVSYVASKGIKRLREQASQGAAAATTLAETMKANEELTVQNSKLSKDYAEAMTLCDERQKGLETLQAELIKGGLMNEKFNFSKLTSREKVPNEPHAAMGAASPSLEVVKAEASKAAGASGNPIQQNDLLASLLGRSRGGLRMTPSGTNHSHLGAVSGEPDLGSLLRA